MYNLYTKIIFETWMIHIFVSLLGAPSQHPGKLYIPQGEGTYDTTKFSRLGS